MFVARPRVFVNSNSRYRLKILLRGFIILCLFFLVLNMTLTIGLAESNPLAAVDDELYSEILADGLPGLGAGIDLNSVFSGLLQLLTNIDSRSPATIISYELNFGHNAQAAVGPLAFIPTEEDYNREEDYYLPGQKEDLTEWISIPENEFPTVQLNGEPMILIYTTHNAETYKPSDGSSKLEGKNGGVAKVSKTLAQALESQHSIKTVYSDVIHDYPDYTKSYINSLQTVKKFLKKYPSIQVVLDIHRDAGLKSRNDTLVKINNKNCAKVLIMVGTEHANYKKNLAFAEKIASQAEKQYPGLIKGIRLAKDRRYNQNLHPQALLLEFGSDLNTQEDANNSAVLMAEIIANVLKGKNN
ncbi:MAG: stage II sporulation protein P [Peptococcia bacterium]